MPTIPIYTSVLFVLITFLSVYLFYRASGKQKPILYVLLTAMAIEAALGLSGFFTVTNTIPPRLFILLIVPLAFVIFLFSTEKGRRFIDSFDVKRLTMLHSIRILVEIVLFQLFLYKAVPVLMTFEGRNMDIFSGLSAPLIYYFVWVKKSWNKTVLLAWNICCLLILAVTVSVAILSMPTPFQQIGFDQPTVAVFYFPFVWLPGIVVPVVYFSHIVAIRQLWREMSGRSVVAVGTMVNGEW
jgi:hypothetical protein